MQLLPSAFVIRGRRLVVLPCFVGGLAAESMKVFQPIGIEATAVHGRSNGTARLAIVGAVREAAPARPTR